MSLLARSIAVRARPAAAGFGHRRGTARQQLARVAISLIRLPNIGEENNRSASLANSRRQKGGARQSAPLEPLPCRNYRRLSARSSNARAPEPMLDQVLSWAAINSGSRNLGGLERWRRAGRRIRCTAGMLRLGRSGPRRGGGCGGSHIGHPARAAPAFDGAPDCSGAAAFYRPHGHRVRRRSPVPGDTLAGAAS